MSDHKIQKSTAEELSSLKQDYLGGLIAPIDGMWASFVSMADHYAIMCGEDVVGYTAINEEQIMLRFYVKKGHDQAAVFAQIIDELSVKGAVVATQEIAYLSLCMDNQKSISVNALLYRCNPDTEIEVVKFPDGLDFRGITTEELQTAIDFAVAAIGAPEDWLRGYYSERIADEELFGLWRGEILIATGECRPSADQKPYADLGMVVSADCRGQGLATAILREMLNDCRDRALSPICSTESTNVAARKAITNAGFKSQTRILEVGF
jgi:GNAT superfamily N-acetyltransferase